MAARSNTCMDCGQPKFLKELWQVDSRGQDICTDCRYVRIMQRIERTRGALGLQGRPTFTGS